MKKYSISIGIIALALSPVFAETESTASARAMLAQGRPIMAAQMQMMTPTITTGDAATDAKIKALQTEMEAKIKAIRDEYQTKIKVVIGDRKVTISQGNGMDMRRGGEDHMMMAASSSKGEGNRGMMMRQGYPGIGSTSVQIENKGGSMRMQVRAHDDETGDTHVNVEMQGGVRGFFGRLFGH